jgi:hypothetical protein
MSELKGLVDNWILLAQGLIGSIGALALAMGELPRLYQPREPPTSVGNRRRSCFCDAHRRHPLACLCDLLAVLVGVEVGDPTAADVDDVGSLVHIRLTRRRRDMSNPLDRHQDVPRGPARDNAPYLESQLRAESVETLEPNLYSVPAVPFAPKCVGARENMVDIVRELRDDARVTAGRETGENLQHPPPDERSIHPARIAQGQASEELSPAAAMGSPVSELKGLLDNWIPLAQGLIGSIGALA